MVYFTRPFQTGCIQIHLSREKFFKTYKTFAEADKAAKQFITQQTLEPGRKREKDSRTDDREEEYQEKEA